MSNDLVLREAWLKQFSCIVRERQLRFFGHVARLPAEYDAHQILSYREPNEWTMPKCRQQASLLQLESYLRNTGMAGPASALAMGRRRPKKCRCNVHAATRYADLCSHI